MYARTTFGAVTLKGKNSTCREVMHIYTATTKAAFLKPILKCMHLNIPETPLGSKQTGTMHQKCLVLASNYSMSCEWYLSLPSIGCDFLRP